MHPFEVGAEVVSSRPDFVLLRTIADTAYEVTPRNCTIIVYSSLVSIEVILRGKSLVA